MVQPNLVTQRRQKDLVPSDLNIIGLNTNQNDLTPYRGTIKGRVVPRTKRRTLRPNSCQVICL